MSIIFDVSLLDEDKMEGVSGYCDWKQETTCANRAQYANDNRFGDRTPFPSADPRTFTQVQRQHADENQPNSKDRRSVESQ